MDSAAAPSTVSQKASKKTVAEKLAMELTACKDAVIGDLQSKVPVDILELVRGALDSYMEDRANGKKRGKGTKRKAAEGAEPKKPNAYNIFVRETMKSIRTDNPTVSNTEAMKIVAQKWSEAKANKAATETPAAPASQTTAPETSSPEAAEAPVTEHETAKKPSAPKKKAAAK